MTEKRETNKEVLLYDYCHYSGDLYTCDLCTRHFPRDFQLPEETAGGDDRQRAGEGQGDY